MLCGLLSTPTLLLYPRIPSFDLAMLQGPTRPSELILRDDLSLGSLSPSSPRTPSLGLQLKGNSSSQPDLRVCMIKPYLQFSLCSFLSAGWGNWLCLGILAGSNYI